MTDLSIDFLKTGLPEIDLSATDLLEIDLLAIGFLKAVLSNLNDLELIREPEETVGELAFGNHAVERAKRAAVFFRDAVESESVAVLALLCLFQSQVV